MKIRVPPLGFKGGTSFVDHLCFLCLVFLMLSRLFIAALWSSTGKELTSWLLLEMNTSGLLRLHDIERDPTYS